MRSSTPIRSITSTHPRSPVLSTAWMVYIPASISMPTRPRPSVLSADCAGRSGQAGPAGLEASSHGSAYADRRGGRQCARISSRLKVGADEIVHGETQVEGSGEFAQMLRRFVLQSEGKSAQVALEGLGKQLNVFGKYGWKCRRQGADPSLTASGRPGRPPTSLWDCFQWHARAGRFDPVHGECGLFFGPVTRNRVNAAICQPRSHHPGGQHRDPGRDCPQGFAEAGFGKREELEFKREWWFDGQTIVEQSEMRSTVDTGICSKRGDRGGCKCRGRNQEHGRAAPAI